MYPIEGHYPEFQREINTALLEEKCPWLLADGRLFHIDPEFLDLAVVTSVIEYMQDGRFRGALDEFVEARAELTAGNYKGAVHNACKSVESVLKTILGKESGTASQLLRALGASDFFDDLPPGIATSIMEPVFMGLPVLRNRLGGHGQGQDVVNVTADYAELAVHLAASFNLFFVKRYLTKHPARQ